MLVGIVVIADVLFWSSRTSLISVLDHFNACVGCYHFEYFILELENLVQSHGSRLSLISLILLFL